MASTTTMVQSGYSRLAPSPSDPFIAMPASHQPSRAGPSASSRAKSRPTSISLAPIPYPAAGGTYASTYVDPTPSTSAAPAYANPPSPAPFVGVRYNPQGSSWPTGPALPPSPLTASSSYATFSPYGPHTPGREGPRTPLSPLRLSTDGGMDDEGIDGSYGFAAVSGRASDRLSPYPLDRRPSYQKNKPLQQLLRKSTIAGTSPTSTSGFPFPSTPPLTPPFQAADAAPPAPRLPAALATPPPQATYGLPTPPPSGSILGEDGPEDSVSSIALAKHVLHPRFAKQYKILGELGSGGFGFVVRAIRIADKRIVAVKFIIIDKVPSHAWVKVPRWNRGDPTGPEADGLIPMEAFVLRGVKHENVVSFIDLFEQGAYFYLVMEHHGTPWVSPDSPPKNLTSPCALPELAAAAKAKTAAETSFDNSFEGMAVDRDDDQLMSSSPTRCEGPPPPPYSSSPPRPQPPPMLRRASCDLFECIEQHKRLPEDIARYVFQQVVSCVAYLSSKGICHRDIKDENIVIDKQYRVKLIDFGSAVLHDPRLPAPYYNKFWGTMNFASAEILQGQPYRAAEAEVWALGVLLCLLVLGESPFNDPMRAISGKLSVPINGMTRDCYDLMMRCLTVRPSERITVQEMLQHPWLAPPQDDFTAHRTLRSARPSLMQRAASLY